MDLLMDTIPCYIEKLNEINEDILNLLSNDPVSLESIQMQMDQRHVIIKTMIAGDNKLTENKQPVIAELYEKFVQSSNKIQDEFYKLREKQQQQLANAVKQRKVEQKYNIF